MNLPSIGCTLDDARLGIVPRRRHQERAKCRGQFQLKLIRWEECAEHYSPECQRCIFATSGAGWSTICYLRENSAKRKWETDLFLAARADGCFTKEQVAVKALREDRSLVMRSKSFLRNGSHCSVRYPQKIHGCSSMMN